MSTRNNSIQQVSTTAPVGLQVGDTWFNPSTNQQYQLLPVNGTTVQWAEVPTGANSYSAVTGSPSTWTALQSFLGTNTSLGLALNNAAERVSFVGTGANGVINYNVTNQSILYYIGNSGSNWTINFRGSDSTSLNSIMAIGQSVTAVFLANQSATAYINNAVQVDGVSFTPAWQGGTAPASGTASGTDLYSYTIVKTNEFSFIVFAARTAYSTPVFVTNPPGVVATGLYDFTTASFTPGGTTGRDGPSLANARTGLTGSGVDSWKTNTAFFNVTNGIQYWTVPRTATYVIEAWGGQGGNAGSQQGGRGARIQGNFSLTEGEVIRIVVGQQGLSGAHTQDGQPVAAGGGGTYVMRTPYNTTGSILVIAGGGGGAAQNSWTNSAGINASSSNNGTNGGGGEAGGSSGNGGSSSTGCGGAGFSGNGATGSGSTAGEMAQSFTNGARGGGNARSWGGTEIYGGFGGGGGGGGLSAGGGGGYSGGGPGTWSSPQQGGGGGSYNNGTSAVNENGGSGGATLSGPGRVTITVQAPAGGGGGGGGGAAITLISGTTYDATGIGAVVSIDDLNTAMTTASLPNFGYLRYIIAKSTGNQTITVAYRRSGSGVSQSAFSTLGAAAAYTSGISTLLFYGNDDHDSLFMDADGEGILARSNTNSLAGSQWDSFRGASATASNTSLDSAVLYPGSAFAGSNGTFVAFPKTTSGVWINLNGNQYKVNNLTAQSWDGTSQSVIGAGAPANSLYTISDGVNQFIIGRWNQTAARLCTVDLTSGAITTQGITWSSTPTQANGTEEDAIGTQLFTVDGTTAFHANGSFYFGGTRPWKDTTDSPVSTSGKSSFSAGASTQTDMDVFGSIDGSDRFVWFADWGHDDGGLFQQGNDDQLATRKTNIIHIADNYTN